MKAEILVILATMALPMVGGAISGDPRMFVFAGTGMGMLSAVLFYKEQSRKARLTGKAEVGNLEIAASLLMMFSGGVTTPLWLGMDALQWVPRPPEGDVFALALHWALCGLIGSFLLGGLLEGLVMRLYRRGKSSSGVLVDRLADRLHLPETDSTSAARELVKLSPDEVEAFFSTLSPEMQERIARKRRGGEGETRRGGEG